MSKIYYVVAESYFEPDQVIGCFSSREKATEACERYVAYANENLSRDYAKIEESLFVVYKDHYGIVCVYEHDIDREILLEELKEGLY